MNDTNEFKPHIMPDVSDLTAQQQVPVMYLFDRDQAVAKRAREAYYAIEAQIKAREDAHWAKCEQYFKERGYSFSAKLESTQPLHPDTSGGRR